MAWKEFKREERLETLREYEPYQLQGPLEALIEDLSAAKAKADAKGWFGLHVDVRQDYEDVMIYVRAWRNETDEEFNKRWEARKAHIEKTKRRQERAAINAAKKLQKTEEEQRALYEELKRKFG